MSSFRNSPFPSSGHTEFTRPCSPNIILQKNVESDVQTIDISVDDDDICVVFSEVPNLTDEQNAACQWMMKALTQADRTSRILAYHVELLRQTLKLRSKEKEMRIKNISHLAGKFYQLLKKASRSLTFQREFLSKEFRDWLNAEKTKCGILTTEESEPNATPAKDGTSDAEATQEPELLLDMEISCESDHEDVSSPNSGIQEEQIECNERLSDSDTDSDDPFSDSESSKWRNVVHTMCRPFLSRTVKELLRDKFSSKQLLQLLTEQLSKTVDPENKQIASRKEFRLADASTQTAAPGKQELTVGEKEFSISTLKQCVYTGVLSEQISSNSGNLSLHSVEIGVGSGNENEKHVTMESADPVCEAIQNSLMESSSSGISDMAGNEGSHSHKTPCSNSRRPLDPISEAIRDSLIESSTNRTGETRSEEGLREKTPCSNNEMKSVDLIREPVQNSPNETSPNRTDKTCSNNGTESVDPVSESIQNSSVKSSHSSTDDKTENEKSQNKTPCDNNKTKSADAISEAVKNSLTNSPTRIDNKSSNEGSHREKTPCSDTGMAPVDPFTETIHNSSVEISPSRMDDKTKNENIPCTNSKTESVDAVSEAAQNSPRESSPGRIDNKTGNEECRRGKTLCENGNIDSVQNVETDAETDNIHMNNPIQKRTSSEGSCNAQNRKRKYQLISKNDMSSNSNAKSCPRRRVARTARTDSPSTDSSVIVPVFKLQKTDIPVNDFSALANSAVQKNLIKPCFVSIVKLGRNN
jgi:hypothetical protein